MKFSSSHHLCLIGTKSDLGRNEKVIDKAGRIADKMGCPTYFFITSAKTGENLEKPFQAMVSLAIHSKRTVQKSTIPRKDRPKSSEPVVHHKGILEVYKGGEHD